MASVIVMAGFPLTTLRMMKANEAQHLRTSANNVTDAGW
jgi:hypothetical protein